MTSDSPAIQMCFNLTSNAYARYLVKLKKNKNKVDKIHGL